MDKILHQLRLVVDPIIYTVLYIPGGAGFLPSTVAPEKWWLEDDPFLLGFGKLFRGEL